MRTPIIAGNWKLNKTAGEARLLVQELRATADAPAEVVVCPPFTALAAAVAAAAGSRLAVGAQDLFWKDSGAYTGQVSGPMLVELGITHVIIGHSERRGRFGVPEEGFTPEVLAHFGESDRTVNLKLHAALRHGLVPLVCCGETLAERRAGKTDTVVTAQVVRALEGLAAEAVASTVLAYEPVWAIGTGETCAAEEANRVCGIIRGAVAAGWGAEAAARLRVQYGGSVKATNAAELLSAPEIDGALVGGASLSAPEFAAIVRAAA